MLYTPAELPTEPEVEAHLASVETELRTDVFQLQEIPGTGHERGTEGHDKEGLNRLMRKLSTLEARFGPRLEEALASNGLLLDETRNRIARARKERQHLTRSRRVDYDGLILNRYTTPETVATLHARRRTLAKTAAAELTANPRKAADATNNSLAVHGFTNDPEARARILVDSLLQFRARWRSQALMDVVAPTGSGPQGPGDRTQGKIESSGIVGVFEARLAAQEAPLGDGFLDRRERALTRLAIVHFPHGSVDEIFLARNLVGSLREKLGRRILTEYLGPGRFAATLYAAIHQNYCADTPAIVDYFVRDRVFTDGPHENRLRILDALVTAASATELSEARETLHRLEVATGYSIPSIQEARDLPRLRRLLLGHLGRHSDYAALRKMREDEVLECYRQVLDLHDAVCGSRATGQAIREELFHGLGASPDLARLSLALRSGRGDAILAASVKARRALLCTFAETPGGFERLHLWRLDREAEALALPELGRGLFATLAALEHTLASGLSDLRVRANDSKVARLEALLPRFEKAVDQARRGQISVGEIRRLMLEAHESALEVSGSLQILFKRRERAIHLTGIDVGLDPEFVDNLVKGTALHYLLGLSSAGASWGTKPPVIDGQSISIRDGVKILSPVGPTLYRDFLVAGSIEDLVRMNPSAQDFCAVEHLIDPGGADSDAPEKKLRALVATGGLVVDRGEAPSGFSHASVLARGHGMSLSAVPNLADLLPALKEISRSRPIHGARFYVDDRDNALVIMSAEEAARRGLLEEGVHEPDRIGETAVSRLWPGRDHEYRYFDLEAGLRKLVDRHGFIHGAERDVLPVEIIVPDLNDDHGLPAVPTLEEVGSLSSLDEMRQLAGMKGAVLADLLNCEELVELGVIIPSGVVVTPNAVADLLQRVPSGDGTLLDRWLEIFTGEPRRRPGAKAEKTSELLKTEFYRDAAARHRTVDELRAATVEGLERLLLDGDAPTPVGQTLLDAFQRSDALREPSRKKRTPQIHRSSQSLEDLLHKTGAGQHESVGGLENDADRLRGLVEVIASHWSSTAIDNNVRGELNLAFDWPAVVVERFVRGEVSGVAVSRGRNGELGEIGYQAKRGTGGGVDAVDGATPSTRSVELGQLGPWASTVEHTTAADGRSLLTPRQKELLRKAVLVIERRLNERLAPDAEELFPVDVEWAFVRGKLHVYQARFASGY